MGEHNRAVPVRATTTVAKFHVAGIFRYVRVPLGDGLLEVRLTLRYLERDCYCHCYCDNDGDCYGYRYRYR